MTRRNLNISGKVCPYCVLAVQKETKTMKPGDELVVTCDHPSAATTSIPQFAQDNGMTSEITKISPGVWEILLVKK